MIIVELAEALASVVLVFLHQVDMTAVPLIITHFVALITLAIAFSMLRSKRKDVEKLCKEGMRGMVGRPDQVIRTGLKGTLLRWGPIDEWNMLRYISIVTGVFLASGSLILVSALAWHHTAFIQAGLSVMVMSKGHLRRHFLDFLERRARPGTAQSSPRNGSNGVLAGSTTALISPSTQPVYIAMTK